MRDCSVQEMDIRQMPFHNRRWLENDHGKIFLQSEIARQQEGLRHNPASRGAEILS
jgi:hypothetical protein